MGTRRSAVCAASVAALLLVFAAPAAAVVSGPVMESAERSGHLLEDVEEIVDDLLDEVDEIVDEADETVDGALGDGESDPIEEPDDGETTGGDDEASGEPEDDEGTATVERSTPASAVALVRTDRSHQTSLQRFRVADLAAADHVQAPATVDDVLEPVVRDGDTDVSPATDTPILAAPAHAQAVAATPGGMRWYTALGGAALILLLVSSALLAEIRPQGSGAS